MLAGPPWIPTIILWVDFFLQTHIRNKKHIEFGNIATMVNAHIIGTGRFAPQRIVTNAQLHEIVDTSNDWIVRRTGITERRIASPAMEENTTQMAATAARKALAMADVRPEEIDNIIKTRREMLTQPPAPGISPQLSSGSWKKALPWAVTRRAKAGSSMPEPTQALCRWQ